MVDDKFDKWFQSPILDQLEVLYFEGGRPLRPLPQSTLRFTSTLRIVNLAFCKFPRIDLAHQLHFPQHKILYLYGVSISTFDIHSLVGGCTTLEGLQIEGTSGFIVLPLGEEHNYIDVPRQRRQKNAVAAGRRAQLYRRSPATAPDKCLMAPSGRGTIMQCRICGARW